ncbi:MAG: F0F1 ATP synthase subunit alpha [Candidatus Omnitrophica bacterium]|nr:F0F1 ATP synthase subunit alpha [Candidatus Omnitrophota bacterium]
MQNVSQNRFQVIEPSFDVREVGHVKSVRDCIVRAVGLPSCLNGQLVEFCNGTQGMVMGFTEEDVQILAFGVKGELRAGDEVYNKGGSFRVPVGDNFLGRVVNALGEPADGKGPVESKGDLPVFGDAPEIMERVPVHETMEMGTRMVDAAMAVARGQRQLLIGDKMTGKSTIALDAVLNQKGRETICIYCVIGKPYSTLVKVLQLLHENEAMEYSIVVSGIASTSAGEQYLAPYTGAALGEYFMRRGKHVLMVLDDLTKHAWVYRQLSLLMERAPGREAYPGDIFYIHSQLVERAACLAPEFGGGSMTFLPICDILQGDVTGFIPTNLISMTDGQIYMSTPLFNKGQKPAIDLGLSVSRIGSKGQWKSMKEVSGRIRLEHLLYQDLLKSTQLRSSLSADAAARIKRGSALSEIFVQGKASPVPIEEQVVLLHAWNQGVMDELSDEEKKRFKDDFPLRMREWYPQMLQEMRDSQKLTDQMKEKIVEGAKRYVPGWSPKEK